MVDEVVTTSPVVSGVSARANSDNYGMGVKIAISITVLVLVLVVITIIVGVVLNQSNGESAGEVIETGEENIQGATSGVDNDSGLEEGGNVSEENNESEVVVVAGSKDCSVAESMLLLDEERTCYDSLIKQLKVGVNYGSDQVALEDILIYVDGSVVPLVKAMPNVDSRKTYKEDFNSIPGVVSIEVVVDGVTCDRTAEVVVDEC